MTSGAEWLLPGKEKGVHNLLAKFVTTGGPTFTFAGSAGPQSDWATIDGLGRLRNADETLTKTDGSTVDHSYTYLYDMRSELTEATITNIDVGDWTGVYHYKKNGDMDYRTIQASQTDFTYTGNLMDSATGGESFTLTWDENGNMKKLPDDSVTTELIYNWDNKLRYGEYGNTSIDIKYDPSGNRIFKDSSKAGQRKYIVDIVGKLPTILLELEEVNPGEHSVVKTYIYANSQIIAQHDGKYDQTRYFYLHDRLGSVRQIIDTSGNVKNRYTYRPFGETYDDEGEVEETITNPFKFTGQYFDVEIDEYYLRARQYDPYISRFTSRDPILGKFEEPLTLHRYLYCGNDPINRLDQDGEFFTFLAVYLGVTIDSAFRSHEAYLKGKIYGTVLVSVGAFMDYYLVWPRVKKLSQRGEKTFKKHRSEDAIDELLKWLIGE